MVGLQLPREDDTETDYDRPPKRRKTFHNGTSSTLSSDHYTIAWICALHIEMAAARAMLDDIHPGLPQQDISDGNSYTLGSVGGHNVVIACLPTSQYGTNNAANVVTNMRRTFPNIRLGLMVGIGGAAPSKADLRLGDVVVGTRVMQYDMGKVVADGKLQRIATATRPDNSLCTVVSNLRAQHELEASRVPAILEDKMGRYAGFGRPSTPPDRLFQASYKHEVSATTCDGCDQSKLVQRSTRFSHDPVIHYGAIASGNQVMKDAITRDSVARELDIICFEMEAAGLMDVLPCLPIRGICDYSDSHKAKEWQRYAAATAAAYTRELLELVPVDGQASEPQSTPTLRSESSLDPDRRQRLLDSLRFDQIDARKTSIRAAHAKTCHWFLKHPDYQAWLDPDKVSQHHGFLWLRGKPGVGKSTIMKFIYLKTKRKDRREQSITASFFFNARGEDLEKSVLGMYRSLLLQLLEGFPDLQQVLDDPDLVPRNQTECPSLNMLKDLFHSAVSDLGQRSFTCFVDALDECDEQQVMEMVQYFEELAEHATNNEIRLQICFSSRHYPYIDIRLGVRLTMEDQQGHADDLEKYIQNQLRIRDTALVEELRPRILEKAAGVFLWVVLVVDILNRENRRGRLALRKRLAEVPSGLSELFKDILRRDTDNMEDLLLCILWILYAKRPLSPGEYHHALWSGLAMKDLVDTEFPDATASDASELAHTYVTTSSKGLAEVTKSKQPTVQFIHESVRDFLVKDGGLHELWPDLGFNWKTPSHDRLKQSCSYYMNHPSVQASVAELTSRPDAESDLRAEISKPYPFLGYASQHVLHHADAAADAVSQDDFLAQFPVPDWVSIVNIFEKFKSRRYTRNASLLYLLAERRLPTLLRWKLKDDPYVYTTGERYGHPLLAAVAMGDKDCVSALLGLHSSIVEGVDILEGLQYRRDFEGGNFTPLSWAAWDGRTAIVKLLLKKGASVNEADKQRRRPLVRASERGQLAAAKILVENGAYVNRRGGVGLISPILQAMINGHERMVRFLAEEGADINAYDRQGRTALSVAAERGQDAIVRFLIDKGANVNVYGEDGRTILCLAIERGQEALANMLLEKGANLDKWEIRGLPEDDLLLRALKNGQTAIARVLLETEPYVNPSYLILAAEAGDTATVTLLIDRGVNVNARKQGQTALCAVAKKGDALMTRLLIEKGADINARDLNGDSALCSATRKGDEAIARLLIDEGADTSIRDQDGYSALHIAIMAGHEGMARLLVEKGADTNVRDFRGRTPLHRALLGNMDRISCLLIERGAATNLPDH
ncbi:hypothetical protein ACJZ2D_003076 [Fusarium nematophilum]